jgi:hypothetical protein
VVAAGAHALEAGEGVALAWLSLDLHDDPARFWRYLVAALFILATPVMLGLASALIVAVVATGLALLRTALEERTLLAELPAYPEYARRVCYRLFLAYGEHGVAKLQIARIVCLFERVGQR